MIFFKRRRLIFWLARAYIKRWRRTILISFILGLIVFFILRFGVNYFIPLLPFTNQQTIGIVGSYTVDDLPPEILSEVSHGLTSIDSQGVIKPDVAESWEIKNNGKTYIFHLKNNLFFSDGTKLTSEQIRYNFLDVTTQRPNDSTIVFDLKSPYAPFLVTVSRPIFKDGLTGMGEYRVQSVNVNGNFVQTLNLVSVRHDNQEVSYQFYPTEDALKTAFVLGDVLKIEGVTGLDFQGKNLSDFKNDQSIRRTDYSTLVTLFYNTQDKELSDKRLREALSYTIPDKFSSGVRSYGPFPPKMWVAQNGLTTYSQDLQHAKLLLGESQSSTSSAVLELSTLPKFESLAKKIQVLWEKIGIKTKIKVVDSLPPTFQIFLGEFNVPKDPDQYLLWHSSQQDNISNYKNLRIDKLLEDGRMTVDISQRQTIYADFQKYFLDDPPASFLYFPYVYDITRK